jgi:hypothetical protein
VISTGELREVRVELMSRILSSLVLLTCSAALTVHAVQASANHGPVAGAATAAVRVEIAQHPDRGTGGQGLLQGGIGRHHRAVFAAC